MRPAERTVAADLAPGGDALPVEGVAAVQHLVLLREELDLDGLELRGQGVEADGAGFSRLDRAWNSRKRILSLRARINLSRAISH